MMLDKEQVKDIEDRIKQDAAFLAKHNLMDYSVLLAIEEVQSWVARVQRILLETRIGVPCLEETARRLHVTPRTLHRRLVAEGSSFRELVAARRLKSAVEQLTLGEASIEEVSYLLGYTDPANFRRAFRRWTGRSPSSFRAEHAVTAPARSPGSA